MEKISQSKDYCEIPKFWSIDGGVLGSPSSGVVLTICQDYCDTKAVNQYPVSDDVEVAFQEFISNYDLA